MLSSTILSKLHSSWIISSACAVIYFYFDWNEEKRSHKDFLRSLISQLLAPSDEVPNAMEKLFPPKKKGSEPSLQQLLAASRGMLNGWEENYVVVNALDECTDVGELLENLESIRAWNLAKLHVLFTSRRQATIQSYPEKLIVPEHTIGLQDEEANTNIRVLIKEKLRNNFKRWGNTPEGLASLELIETTLIDEANGMYISLSYIPSILISTADLPVDR